MPISIPDRFGVPSEPFEVALWQWSCMLRCAIPAQVVSFDPVKLTCEVQVMIQELVRLPRKSNDPSPNPGNTQNLADWDTIPNLRDVPVVMMHAGGWSLTFPVEAGDECLLIFADACIDGWWESGNLSAQYDRRRHDLSDAFALFGPWSQKPSTRLYNYSTGSMQLRSDDQSVVIDLAPGAIDIAAPVVTITAGTVTLTGASAIHLAGPVTVEGSLSATGGIDVTGTMTVTGDIESIGNIHTTGNIVAEGTIVAGSPTFAATRAGQQPGMVAAEHSMVTLGDITAEGNIAATGSLAAGTTIYAADDISSGTHVRALGDVTSAGRTISLTDHIHSTPPNDKPTSPPIPLVTATQPAPEPPPAEPKE
jgi:hypothetical protein